MDKYKSYFIFKYNFKKLQYVEVNNRKWKLMVGSYIEVDNSGLLSKLYNKVRVKMVECNIPYPLKCLINCQSRPIELLCALNVVSWDQ